MALSISSVHPQASDDVWGRLRVAVRTVTFDDSYPTGGESFTPADVGLSEFLFVDIQNDADGTLGFSFEYDYTAQTIVALGVEQDADAATTEPLDEEDDTEDLSAVVVRVLCIGF